MKVAFVKGHSSVKKGAWGNMGISEFDFYGKLIPQLIKRLQSEAIAGHKYQEFERGIVGGYGEKMKKLHKRIDAWGADITIAFHFNGAGDERINGHEILYCSQKGHDLAVQLDELFDAYLDNNDRNLKKRTKKQRGGGFLCRGKSVCILIEPFFAAHQNRYVEGGDMRENLLQALVDFITGLN